jgi:hypothetical protein
MNQESQDSPRKLPIGATKGMTLEHNLYAKWANMSDRTTSMRAAINAMCAHCMGCNAEHMESGYKDDIKNCTSTGCPLHPFRPYKEK